MSHQYGGVHMKRFVSLGAILIVMCSRGLAANTFSDDPRFTDEKLKTIEQSLRNGLESGNAGVQASAAQVVREVKALVPRYEFSGLIAPLVHMVKDERTQPATRIVAALALLDLDRGTTTDRQ
jgi:hypothetical protein